MAESTGTNAVILAGLTLIMIVAGYAVGRDLHDTTSTVQLNIFKAYNDQSGDLTAGFACLCQKTSPSAANAIWKGLGSGCDPIDLNDDWIPDNKKVKTPLIPGACCLVHPKIIELPDLPGGLLPVPDDPNCWVSL